MQTVSLSWQHSGELAAVLALTGLAMGRVRDGRVRSVAAFVRETAMIALLYGLWQLAGQLSVTGTHDAFVRARWIERVQHDVFLPSEASVQHLIIGHPLLVQGSNLYYAAMHFPMMFVFLIWMFVRHRDRYRPVRTVLAWTTLCCLLIQLIPVAPPRMLTGLGIKDTGLLYDQSVYANGFAFDQLSAMPSVHVTWAVLVGYYTWRIGVGPWRYLGVAHALMTTFVVVATGNHWWLDGIVGVAVLAVCARAVVGVRTAWHAVRTDVARDPVDGHAEDVLLRPRVTPSG